MEKIWKIEAKIAFSKIWNSILNLTRIQQSCRRMEGGASEELALSNHEGDGLGTNWKEFSFTVYLEEKKLVKKEGGGGGVG